MVSIAKVKGIPMEMTIRNIVFMGYAVSFLIPLVHRKNIHIKSAAPKNLSITNSLGEVFALYAMRVKIGIRPYPKVAKKISKIAVFFFMPPD